MKDLLAAKEAALSWLKPATREILKRFQKKLTVQHKADQSPVTLADQKAEEILRKKIQREFPDHGIIGEEFGEQDSHREWVWTIDPIDGTRSFIQGLPMFATLLSLLRKGEPVMGIICLPALGVLARGESAAEEPEDILSGFDDPLPEDTPERPPDAVPDADCESGFDFC